MARLIVKSPYIKCGFHQRGDSLPQRTSPSEPHEREGLTPHDPALPMSCHFSGRMSEFFF